jgi:hypothetical protein
MPTISKRDSTFSQTKSKSRAQLTVSEADLSSGLDNPAQLGKEIVIAVSQLERLFIQRLKSFYINEISEIIKTVRLPVPKYSHNADWDIELVNIMSALRS